MNNAKNVIGEVSVEVKAGLSVDEKTFRTCLNLISIYAENQGAKGIFVNLNDGSYPLVKLIETDESLEAAQNVIFGTED